MTSQVVGTPSSEVCWADIREFTTLVMGVDVKTAVTDGLVTAKGKHCSQDSEGVAFPTRTGKRHQVLIPVDSQ